MIMVELHLKSQIESGMDLHPIEYKGIRKIMIINYVDPDEWRDKEQCFY